MGKALHIVVTILNNKFDEKAGHIHTQQAMLANLIRSTHFDVFGLMKLSSAFKSLEP